MHITSSSPLRRSPLTLPPVLSGWSTQLDEALRLQNAGKLSAARELCQRILDHDPENAACLHLLGINGHLRGQHAAALRLLQEAIRLDSGKATYFCDMGTVLQAQGELEAALSAYRHALSLNPHLAEAHINLTAVLYGLHRLEEAMPHGLIAIQLRPHSAEAHINLGLILVQRFTDTTSDVGDCSALESDSALSPRKPDYLETVASIFERAIALKPDFAKSHHNLGFVLYELGQWERALSEFETALALKPDFRRAKLSLSLSQLLKCDFEAGWRNYEARWKTRNFGTAMRTYDQPLWTPELEANGRILIWAEQGIGDEIQFAGLIPDLLRAGADCLLDCDPRLRPLFARSFPEVEVVSGIAQDASVEVQFSSHLPCGSLPKFFRRSIDCFAETTSPYLFANADTRDEVRSRYFDGRRLIGLAWYTRSPQTGHKRSMELPLLSSLLKKLSPSVKWIGLQYGDHDELERQAIDADAPIFIDRSVDQMVDVDRFAAQVAAMDMVLTINNSTAHLAGALGIPTWLMLPFSPDWRWLAEGETSLWYPSLRLFRQRERGNWQEVIERVAEALSNSIPE